MPMNGLDNITNLLGTFLDVQSRRAEVVAGNLANADTPGYIAKEISFADFLKDAAARSLAPAAHSNQPALTSGLQVVNQTATTIGIDGNTVDNGREMSTMADAGMKFLQGTQFLQMRLRTLRLAIREGR